MALRPHASSPLLTDVLLFLFLLLLNLPLVLPAPSALALAGRRCTSTIPHAEYASLTPADLPGIRAIVDGRGVLPADGWADVDHLRVGDGTLHRNG